ncbi:MAG: glycosyltransferase family 2 protein, partial [Alphaproteobacteria bacterium]|nr:glycosyltransferase family 2 protein [Alphaproteobacteria bacterium]
MPTTLRPTIADAVRSVFAQRFEGTVQILVGADLSAGDASRLIDDIGRSVPDSHSVLFFYPGYSTSQRHGGMHAAHDGGALRTILSYLANSRYVAYLDDENWWSDDHLSSLYHVLSAGADWAYASRWYVHPASRKPVCRDEWESVGPARGFFRSTGWVDPNCLALDKIACEAVLRWWAIPVRNSPKAMDGDRNVFRFLSTEFNGVPTGKFTVFYQLDETDPMHPRRLNWIGPQQYRSCSG